MISRDLKLKVGYATSALDQPLHLYMYDRNILLNITIDEFDFKFGGNLNGNFIGDSTNITKAKSYLKSPSGKIISYPYVSTEIHDNVVKILITEISTNSKIELGEHYIQIVLYDNDGSCLHLHPFKFFVHDLIALTDKEDFDYGSGNKPYVPTYNPNLITSILFNSIEEKLNYVYSGLLFYNTEIESMETYNKTVGPAINELKTLCNSLSDYIDQKQVEGISIENEKPSFFNYKEIVRVDKPVEKERTINNEKVSKIEVVNKFHNKINPGDGYIYRVNVEPESAKKIWVKWKSSDPTVAKVNSTGKVVGLRKGKATISAYSIFDSTLCDSFEVEICKHIPATSIVVKNTNVTVGKAIALDISFLPENCTENMNNLEFIIENSAIAEYFSGHVKGISEGTTNLIVRLKNNPKKSTIIKIKVEPQLELTIKDYPFKLYDGDVLPIYYDVKPSNAVITWSYSDNVVMQKNKLIIKKSGTFTLNAEVTNGRETITVSKEFNAEVYKLKAPTAFYFKKTEFEISGVSTTIEPPVFSPDDADIDTRLMWTIDNEEIATVTPLGTSGLVSVISKKNGTVKVTASSLRYSDVRSKYVKITFKDAVPTSIRIADKNLFSDLIMKSGGEPLRIVASVIFEPPRSIKDLKWYITDNSSITVEDYYYKEDYNYGILTLSINKPGRHEIFLFSPANYLASDGLIINARIPVERVCFEGSEHNTPITHYNEIKLTPKIYPEDATNKKLLWKSSNTGIATVDENGIVTRRSSGPVTFTCTSEDNLDATAEITLTFASSFSIYTLSESNNGSPISLLINTTKNINTKFDGYSYLNGKLIEKHSIVVPDVIRSIRFTEKQKEFLVKVENLNANDIQHKGLFKDCSNLVSVSFKNTDNISNCAHSMFYNCTSLVDFTGLENARLNDASYMLYNCKSLPDSFLGLENSIITKAEYMFYGTRFKVLPKINMNYLHDASNMFYGCNTLEDVYTNIGDLELILENANSMFCNCTNLKIGPSFKISLLIDATAMFAGCKKLKSLKLEITYVKKCYAMFRECESLNFSATTKGYITEDVYIDTSWATDMKYMFFRCVNMEEAPILDMSSVYNARSMFYECTSLRRVPELDMSNFSENQSIDLSYMFNGCSSLESVDYLKWPPKEIYYTFSTGSSWIYLSTVTDCMFGGCSSLKSFPHEIDCCLYSAESMFSGCTSLDYVATIDIEFARRLNHMFYNCTSLKKIPTFTKPSYAEKMHYMFYNCTSMKGTANPEVFWDNDEINPARYECFKNCTELFNYTDIPYEWKDEIPPYGWND